MPFDIEPAEKSRWRQWDDAWNRIISDVPESRGRFEWSPSIDVAESEDRITITAELPGLEAQDIDVDIASNMLTLKGEKKIDEAKEGRRFYCRERIHGRFQRSFKLPPGVDSDHVKAGFKNGILTVTIPRSEAHTFKPVEISSA